MGAERPGRPAVDGALNHRRLVRDLTSLLALPAFWSGTDPGFVLRTLFEALEALLEAGVCYGVVNVGPGDGLQMLRADRRPVPTADAAWAPLVAFADVEPRREETAALEVFGRSLRCIRLPVGYAGETGRLVVGSWRASFPDATEIVTLHLALSLAASGLETARVIRERDAAQRAKDEFLAMLGHELRNPLAPIVTALQLMAMKSGGVRTREQAIIERQVGHLRTLVDDLLDVSRITRGRIDLNLERVELSDIVARAVETVMPLMEERRHDVRVSVPGGLAVDADPVRLTQVVSNLLTNAAKYTPPEGRVQVIGAAAGAWVGLRVLDSGTGLSSELLPHVFDLFVQGRRGLARSEGGLGIGLALVKRLVQAHGGSVLAHSGGPGQGSEFVVNLPAARSVRAERSVPVDDRSDPCDDQGAGTRILVVDDNRDAADVTASVLSARGYDVDVAYTGLEALQRAARARPDVVLLDIGLPDLDGYGVAAELRARFPGAPLDLVALTGYGQAHDRARSAETGFSAHLVKPIDPSALTALVQHIVRVRTPAGGAAVHEPADGA